MDPDGWCFIQLIAALFLLFFSCLAAGALLEESSRSEISESGVGVSYRAASALIFAGAFGAWAFACALRLAQSASAALLGLAGWSPEWAKAALGALLALAFGLAVVSLFVVPPLAWGTAHSEEYEAKGFVKAASSLRFAPKLVTAAARSAIIKRGAEELGGVTEEDVLELVDTVEELGGVDENQKEMISNIFELDDVTAGDIMTHRTEIEAVSTEDTIEEIISAAVEFGYSRIPVYEDTLDNIVGIACVKDLLPYVGQDVADIDVKTLLRDTIYVPETCRARELLFEFKQKKVQLAIVVDEYGGTAGIVTMEDSLESIVGDIEDEYDEEEQPLIVRNKDGSLTCDGYAELDDVFELMGAGEVPEDVGCETIGGLLTELLTRIPSPDERPSAQYKSLELTSLDADERRIKSVLVTKKEDEEPKKG